MIRLATLLPDLTLAPELRGLSVAGLSSDSRKVQPGSLFFAVPGAREDGNRYALDAAARGACAIVTSGEAAASIKVPHIHVQNVRKALSHAAALFFPQQPQNIVAITGTSGKTSVASFARQIWTHLGLAAASVGTLGVVSPKGEHYGSLTTPDPVSLHETLHTLAQQGVTHLALEASSHGLDQHRLDGVRLAAGAFTNLSRDHLDYHGNFANYLAAKMRLFEALLVQGQPAIVFADSDVASPVIAACQNSGLNLLTVGRNGNGLHLLDARPEGFSTLLTVTHQGTAFQVRLPLAGMFQTANALVAAGLCIATGSDPAAVMAALENLKGAPGRLEHVGTSKGGQIFVDYAHKPDALQQALQALRPFAVNKLMLVVGCGGDRDAGKRPIMGEIAAQNADLVIITDDNPRSESPALIRAAILAKAPGALEIGDRAAAISHGISLLSEGDILLVAGKGHETGQIIGDRVLPFSDHETVLAALKEPAK